MKDVKRFNPNFFLAESFHYNSISMRGKFWIFSISIKFFFIWNPIAINLEKETKKIELFFIGVDFKKIKKKFRLILKYISYYILKYLD